jgi:hypothetical protein
MTAWRHPFTNELAFLRSIDMSALQLTAFPPLSTLQDSVFLEAVVLPAGLRVIPTWFFANCLRLTRVDTAGCTALEVIGDRSFANCPALREFRFPSSVRLVDDAFHRAAITCVDLSETLVERAGFKWMTFLERVILPRRCVLDDARGLPSLRSLTFGFLSGSGVAFTRRASEIRFESMRSGAEKELFAGRVSAEVAAVLSRESSPSSPP